MFSVIRSFWHLSALLMRKWRNYRQVESKAQPITIEHEDISWEKGLLGDHSPQALIDTLVFYVSMCFALRSGEKHRHLRYHPAQIELVDPVGGIPYLMYREDVSKTNQGGIQHRKVENKEVVRVRVRLYKLYQSHCPPGRPNRWSILFETTKKTKGWCLVWMFSSWT